MSKLFKRTKILATIGPSTNSKEKIELKQILNDKIIAPVTEGDVLGSIDIYEKNKKIGEVSLVARQGVVRVGFADIFTDIFKKWLLK